MIRRAAAVVFIASSLWVACGTPTVVPDAGTGGGTGGGAAGGTGGGSGGGAGGGCAATRESAAFLGAWTLTGSVTKNGATWPVFFPITVAFAPNCSTFVTTNGNCAFTWSPVAAAALPTMAITAATECEPNASAVFNFDGMQVFNGTTHPFPSTAIFMGIDGGTFRSAGDGGVIVEGTGVLGARTSGSEPMSFSYTGAR